MSSPWASINATISDNLCWICNTKFQKGKTKKMFMISQVIAHFRALASGQEANSDFELKSNNMRLCYEELKVYNFNVTPVIENMQKSGIEPWMSGLACGRSNDCSYEVDRIIETPIKPSLDNLPKSEKDCSPNCGCDNPWAFIS